MIVASYVPELYFDGFLAIQSFNLPSSSCWFLRNEDPLYVIDFSTPSYSSYSCYINTQPLLLPDGLGLTLPSGFDVFDTSDSPGIANIEIIAVNNLLQSDH